VRYWTRRLARIVEADAERRIEETASGKVANGGPQKLAKRHQRSTKPIWLALRNATGLTFAHQMMKSLRSTSIKIQWSKRVQRLVW
jgi:hypothetical protein